MVNLNDILDRGSWRLKEDSKTLELQLEKTNFPDLDKNTEIDYAIIFAHLSGEVNDVRPRPTKVVLISELKGGNQILYVKHNGLPINEDTLRKLNLELCGCVRGETLYQGRPHGNHLAANLLHKYNGRITLSNIDEGEYHVQTKVEIPIPQSNIPSNP